MKYTWLDRECRRDTAVPCPYKGDVPHLPEKWDDWKKGDPDKLINEQ